MLPRERGLSFAFRQFSKSTLIRCLNRLEQHQQGDIHVHGIELNNDVKNIDEIRRSRHGISAFQLVSAFINLENCMLAPIWVRKHRELRPKTPCIF